MPCVVSHPLLPHPSFVLIHKSPNLIPTESQEMTQVPWENMTETLALYNDDVPLLQKSRLKEMICQTFFISRRISSTSCLLVVFWWQQKRQKRWWCVLELLTMCGRAVWPEFQIELLGANSLRGSHHDDDEKKFRKNSAPCRWPGK